MKRLTPAQLRVARLYARGFHCREIAQQLKLSPKTVQNRLEEIRERLQIRRMQQAGVALVHRGYCQLSELIVIYNSEEIDHVHHHIA